MQGAKFTIKVELEDEESCKGCQAHSYAHFRGYSCGDGHSIDSNGLGTRPESCRAKGVKPEREPDRDLDFWEVPEGWEYRGLKRRGKRPGK